MRQSILIALLVACLGALGCSLGHDTIHGQVFIVTRGAVNVKMGLVTVAVLPEPEVEKYVEAVTAAHRKHMEAAAKAEHDSLVAGRARAEMTRGPELARAKVALDRARAEAAAAQRVSDEARRAHRRAKAALVRGDRVSEADEDACWQGFCEAVRIAHAKQLEANAAADTYQALLRSLPEVKSPAPVRLQSLPTGRDYFSGLPAAVTSTQTDADGRFTLDVPHKGRLVLAARAQRQIIDSTEEYFWLVRIPDDVRRGELLLLSNSTLTTADSPLSLVKTAE
jgi:hypothetical protein